MDEKRTVEAQPGPQTEFLSTPADIAFYGGAAGGGKTFALLIEPLRHYENSRFGGVIFRRTTKQVRNEGGLWDEAAGLYPQLGAELKETALEVAFPSGARIQFGHLEYEKNVYDWQGAQIAFIGFDEITHFTEFQFFYMMSRNRSTSGVRGYVRGTCNPDSGSWVRRFIAWWIDDDTGLPIPERSGVIRWFIRQNDEIFWADTKAELVDKFGDDSMPKSFTFIPSKVTDNKILMQKDPAYIANLKALPRVERMRLLDGNWNVESSAGMYFQRNWFEIVDAIPAGCQSVRYWDRASTPAKEGSTADPDWTAGLKLERSKQGIFYISHVVRLREGPMNVERAVKNTALQDGKGTWVGIEQDPGQAGVADAQNYVRLLAGLVVKVNRVTKDKVTRALPVSAQCEAGNVKILRGKWNEDLLRELENFPEGSHDDQVDTLSGAFNLLTDGLVGEFSKNMLTKNPDAGTIAGSIEEGGQW